MYNTSYYIFTCIYNLTHAVSTLTHTRTHFNCIWGVRKVCDALSTRVSWTTWTIPMYSMCHHAGSSSVWLHTHTHAHTGCQSIKTESAQDRTEPDGPGLVWSGRFSGDCVLRVRFRQTKRRNVRCLLHLTRWQPHTTTAQPPHTLPTHTHTPSLDPSRGFNWLGQCNLSINHALQIRLSKFNWLWFCKVRNGFVHVCACQYMRMCVCVLV